MLTLGRGLRWPGAMVCGATVAREAASDIPPCLGRSFGNDDQRSEHQRGAIAQPNGQDKPITGLRETSENLMSHSAKPQLSSTALDSVPELCFDEGRYRIRLATTPADVEAALRLRYQVFNVELGEGLASSRLTGRDKDRFDDGCHHLVVEHEGQIVGTYRMQTPEMAAAHNGLYSDGEYHLSDLGQARLDDAVEIGRACVAMEHRKQKVLFGLWRGLARYLNLQGKRYLFGCCSLTSQDTEEGRTVMAWLREQDLVWPGPLARARPRHSCAGPLPDPAAVAAVKLPTLFGTYMRFGVRVASEPAIDREFKTIDFLVIMDTHAIPALVRRMFFSS